METQQAIATGMDAVYFLTKDFARTRAFYENALALRPSFEMAGDEGKFVEYELGDGTTFGLAYLAGNEFHISGGIMFAVGDVHDAVERVKGAGGAVHFDPFESPACTMAWCADLDGNTFCLHKRKSA